MRNDANVDIDAKSACTRSNLSSRRIAEATVIVSLLLSLLRLGCEMWYLESMFDSFDELKTWDDESTALPSIRNIYETSLNRPYTRTNTRDQSKVSTLARNNQTKTIAPWSNDTLLPVLWFDHAEISDLRRSARSRRDRGGIAERLRKLRDKLVLNQEWFLPPDDPVKFSARWNENYGNYIAPLALHCLLFPEDLEALSFAKLYISRMIVQPSWLVSNFPIDEVPVAHSLTGIAVALDFLWPLLTPDLRERTHAKISQELEFMQDMVGKRWWGRSYLQNHVATNFVAIITAGLVDGQVSCLQPNSNTAAQLSHKVLADNMQMLDRIDDGSLNEGVGYTTYTTRGLTQYVSLARRHFSGDTFVGKKWLQRHFYFLYRTVFNGWTETVGFADAGPQWFFGPTSQLRFLDTYVLRSGCGNWLADKIVNQNSLGQQEWKTLFTEFIWHDKELKPEDCPLAVEDPSTTTLHVFNDWGVATYGGGKNSKEETFLSIKAGHLHGRTVSRIVNTAENGMTWRNFNPGHEHPDQGSFVFFPKGVPVVTEGFYDQKYTWLQNTLLFKAPDVLESQRCSVPFLGQKGECNKWLKKPEKNETPWIAEILATEEHAETGMVLMVADFTGWYSQALRLGGVSRTLILLEHDLLVVVDQIQRSRGSPATDVTAMFNNFYNWFNISTSVLAGQKRTHTAILSGSKHRVYWISRGGNNWAMSASVGTHKGGHEGALHYLNVTTSFTHTRCKQELCIDWVAYLFAPNAFKVFDIELASRSEDYVANLQISARRERSTASHGATIVNYDIVVATQQEKLLDRTSRLGTSGRVVVRQDEGHTKTILGIPNVRRQCGPDLSMSRTPGNLLCIPRINSAYMLEKDLHYPNAIADASPIFSGKSSFPFLYCDVTMPGASQWRRLRRRMKGVVRGAGAKVDVLEENEIKYLWSLQLEEMNEILNDPSVRSFIIVHNPYERALSGWIDKVSTEEETKFKFDGERPLPDDFPTFVRSLVKTPVERLNKVWWPMVSFCGISSGMKFDHILKLENMNAWVENITQLVRETSLWGGNFLPFEGDGTSTDKKYPYETMKQHYTIEAIELVRQYYRADFEMFGYDMEFPL